MNAHLTENEITSALCGQEIPEAARQHLRDCLSCRSRSTAFERVVTNRRLGMEQLMPDWQRQKQVILDRLRSQAAKLGRVRHNRWLRPTLAAAAAVVLAVAAGFLRNATTPTLMPTPRPELPIEQILAQTESLLADDSIPGFELFTEISDAELDVLFQTQGS